MINPCLNSRGFSLWNPCIFLAALCLLQSCTFDNSEARKCEAVFFLPENSPAFCIDSTDYLTANGQIIEHEISGWTVFWFDDTGNILSKNVSNSSSSFTLNLTENIITPVIAQPIMKRDSPLQSNREANDSSNNTAIFRPAGCIYPLSKQTGWINGFSAYTLYLLFTGCNEKPALQSNVRHKAGLFNWYKLDLEISKKTEETNGNPWLLDIHKITADIANGSFSKSSIKALQ